ncbi:MAG: OB-fold nucleic acid binding domain-containing protein, partial [Burkholderiales bacterium]
YTSAFALRKFQQIQGFGEYGFPESHSTGFALLAYVSAWLKCHEPAAFTCALLNSQPMGFYAPDQLVQDARRHGVEVRPADVQASDWDCTLESGCTDQPALRLGLCLVKGLMQAAGVRLVKARATATFTGVEDLAHRANMERGNLQCLAAAGALKQLAGHRRAAAWRVQGVTPVPPLFKNMPSREPVPALSPPTEGQDLAADYANLGVTLGRHPLALLRPLLARWRALTASQLRALNHGRQARAAGLVITRQCPDSASGVIFLTLEDETGMVNVVVWRHLAEKQRRELLNSRLLGVTGTVQREGDVLHLVAARLADHSGLLSGLVTHSQDFR